MEKQELKYIFYAVLFSFVIFGLIIPFLINNGANNFNPYLQFLIFNVGIFFFLQIFLKSVVTNNHIKIKFAFGILLFFMAWDIITPPIMVSMQGELLTGPLLSGSATDYIVGDLIQRTGLTGFPVYFVTYTIIPFILFYICSRLIKNFVKET